MKRLIFFITLILALSFSYPLQAQDTQQPSLKLTIKTDKDIYALDEEINLEVTFTNLGGERIRVLLYDDLPEDRSFSCFTLKLQKIEGLELKDVPLKELSASAELSWHGEYLDPNQSAMLHIPVIKKSHIVGPDLEFDPEQYVLSLAYETPPNASELGYFTGRLVSNRAAFEIQDGPRQKNTLVTDGIVKEYYPNDALRLMKPIQNGSLNGIAKEFYATDALRSETTYVDGRKEGFYKMYNLVGEILEEGHYKNNRKDGIFHGYHCCLEKALSLEAQYNNGFLTYRRIYYNNGLLRQKEDRVKEDLTSENYYETGQLQSQSYGTNCRGYLCQTAVIKNFDESGVLSGIMNYQDNDLISAKIYRPDGKIKEELSYATNGAISDKKVYDENGVLVPQKENLTP